MGKKKTVTVKGSTADAGMRARVLARAQKKKITQGTLHIRATYNNTQITLTDKKGNVITTASSGSLGFKGARKSTPFAAAKVGELMGETAQQIGVKEVDIVVKGVGAGREAALRAFASRGGITLTAIRDATPVPHNGVRPRKARRV